MDVAYNDFTSIASQVNEIRRSILYKANSMSITPTNFPLLHKWLEKSEFEKADNIGDVADMFIAPVVNNAECQKIILANKNIYSDIIVKLQDHSSALHDKLKVIVNAEGNSEFKTYLNQIIKYKQPKTDKK